MVASTSVPLTVKSQESFISFYRSLQLLQNINRGTSRDRYELIDRTYQREMDLSKENADAKAANKAGDPSRFQNITVPVVMPQVEAAVTHQTSVFLTGDPLFSVVASAAFMKEALQLETILENNSIRGGWSRELMMFFRDGFKYNFAPLYVGWDQEVTYTPQTDLAVSTKEGIPKKVIWSGNTLRRLDPYNTFIDTRVSPSEFYKHGEFGGWTEMMSRIKLKSFIAALPDKITSNIKPAFESGMSTPSTAAVDTGAQNFYIPSINPAINASEYKNSGTNWMRWAGMNSRGDRAPIDYKDAYEVTTLFAKVLPGEFHLKIPNQNTPQIYKLIIINHSHIIYAELQTNAHGHIPIMVGAPLEDGLDYQTKSLATNGTPFQELATTYMTSIIASRRRAISDRVLYDPSKITKAAINSPNPSAKIPVKPSAYGTPLQEAVYAFPYREDQLAASMGQIQNIIALGNQLTGQNPVSQGQFIKGNKTDGQFDQVMSNATGRDQMAAILLETQVFTPMKLIMKIDILQFQGGTTLYNRDSQKEVEIDPVQLRQAVLNFRITDGLIDADTVLNTDAFLSSMQTLATNASLGAGYNVTQLFSYLMKTQGADLTPFEKSPEQQAFEQAMGAWNQNLSLLIDKGGDPDKMPPAPLPEQFGYDPAKNEPAPAAAASSQTAVQTPGLI